MKRILLVTVMMMGIFLFKNNLNAQELKGGKYKNASISEKYKGNSKVTVRINPNKDIKSYEYKNRVHCTNDSTKVIDLKARETKHSKGLKAFKYKNFK